MRTTIREKRYDALNWQPPGAFSSGWGNYGAQYVPAGFCKDEIGWVCLRGLVASTGAISATVPIFVLPTGYRPGFNCQEVFPCYGGMSTTGNTFMRVDVDWLGQVLYNPATSGETVTYLSLARVRFKPEDVREAGAWYP